MFERFYALCLLQYTYYHPLSFLFYSISILFYFFSFSCTQSCLLLRSNFTFGQILPRIYAKSCARDLHFFYIFIPLLFPYIPDVREILVHLAFFFYLPIISLKHFSLLYMWAYLAHFNRIISH